MAQTAVYGEFSASEVYTLDQVAAKMNRPRKWTYDTFIRPIDHKTKKRLVDGEGQPVPGVFHFKCGSTYLIPGQTLIGWIIENGERCEE